MKNLCSYFYAVLAFFSFAPPQGNSSCLPEKILFESPELDRCRTIASYTKSYFASWGEYLRDNYYLPMNLEFIDSYFLDSGAYASEVTQMLKGENPHLDPTFPYISEVIQRFSIRDIPVVIESSDYSYEFNIRVIESKGKKKLRLVLFSFYHNLQSSKEGCSGWDPTSIDEIGMAPIEIMRALKQYISVDSMMCCSLGGVCFEALKNLKEDLLPPTIIWNRALTSTWKAGMSLFSSPMNYFLYYATSYFSLYADPEKSLMDFCKWADPKRVVVIQAKEDAYFSGDSALDPLFFETLRQANAELYEGMFFVPLLSPRAHHACRLDLILNNQDSGTCTENFLPMKKQESLSDSLVRNLFMEGGDHTCFIVGGNKDSLDSVLYLQALPLLSSYCKLK